MLFCFLEIDGWFCGIDVVEFRTFIGPAAATRIVAVMLELVYLFYLKLHCLVPKNKLT